MLSPNHRLWRWTGISSTDALTNRRRNPRRNRRRDLRHTGHRWTITTTSTTTIAGPLFAVAPNSWAALLSVGPDDIRGTFPSARDTLDSGQADVRASVLAVPSILRTWPSGVARPSIAVSGVAATSRAFRRARAEFLRQDRVPLDGEVEQERTSKGVRL